MRPSALLIVAVVGCGGATQSAPAPSSQPQSTSQTSPLAPTDVDALRTLRALDLHGSNAEDILEHLDAPTRHRYELAVLHDTAHLSCPKMSTPAHCAPDMLQAVTEMRVSDDATFDDPCLRRDLALRAIDELTADDVLAMGDAGIAAVVSVKPPDELLAEYLLDHVEKVAPSHVLAGLVAAREAGVGARAMLPHSELRPEDLVEAQRHHIYAPIEQYPESSRRATMIALLGDPAAPPSVREGVIYPLLEASREAAALPADARAALVAAAGDADCKLAAHATFALAERGDHAFDLHRPMTRAADANARVVCRAAGELLARSGYGGIKPVAAVLHAMEDPGGMTLVLHDVRAGSPATTRTMAITSRNLLEGAVPESSYTLQDLVAVLASCRGTSCARGESEADLTFTAAPDGGAYLSRIEVTNYIGACGDGGA